MSTSDGLDLPEVKAALLRRWRAGTAISPAGPRISPRANRGPLPLSLAQERLWFVEQLQPGMAAYNLFFCAGLDGRLDRDVLTASLDDLVRRHEALCTSIRLDRGGPVQLVGGAAPPTLEVVDLRELGGDAGIAAAAERVEASIHRPFDLEAGPLARLLLCRTRDRDVVGLVVHHLVGDGWSLGVALRDLSAAYEARAAGRTPSLPLLPIQYADFTEWQREQVRDEDWRADLEYWLERLAGLEPLVLPADRPRPAIITPRGDWRPLRLGRALSESLRRLAREEDSTLFMVLLAAWTALLGRLSGQRDLAVGANIANRALPETYGLIGNFVNLLALRTDLGGDPPFRELLRRVRETCVSAFAHQQVPFERVVEELQPERDLSRSVLFQVLLVIQPPTTELRFAGLRMEPIEVGSRTARADLELHLWDQPELVGRIAFSTDLFEAATVERLLERFQRLLEALVADPSRRLSALPLVLPAERPLLDAWGRGPDRDLSPAPVPVLIHRQAQRRPEALAVVAGEDRLDYRTLDSRASQLAHHLRSLGVRREVAVAICLERSAEMVVAVLGVLRAGGAYVPLDPRAPAERLARMISDSRARVVLTEQALAGRVTVPGVTQVCLDRDAGAIASRPDADPAVPIHPEQLAYVIYTSGSTGTPKGVQMPHRALANFVLAQLEVPGMGADDVMATVSSLSFDASVAEVYPPLLVGGTLVVASGDDVADGERLKRLIRAHGVTCLLATPTTWHMLLAAGGLGDRRLRALCGAEACTPDLAEALATSHDSAWNLYGPTETTAWSHADRMLPGAPVSLGRPVANAHAHLVDGDLRIVPVGVAGEVCIGGPGLSRGYLGRPGLTAERFVPDPFGTAPGGRLYRTGDLARYRLDGSLEFLGRRDGQVKLRGHRIELGEIEAALTGHADVAAAVVVLSGTGPDARLVAYVVPASGGDGKAPTTPPLARHLRDRLPEYMVPAAFVFLDELPRTAGGKLDRRRLPAPERERPELESAYVAPRTPREREIAAFAADLLGLERIGMRDDFFDVGGHSLLAARLVSELRERYQVDLVLQKLFLVPTIEHLASMIDEELDRQHRLGSEDTRLRHIVDDMPDQTVDALLAGLLAARAKRPAEREGEPR